VLGCKLDCVTGGQYDACTSESATTPQAPVPPTSLLFVDGTNLDHRCLEAFGRDDIDFDKLFAALTGGTQLLHTHYFTAPYNRTSDERRYRKQTGDFNQLRKIPGVTLHLGRHQARQVECYKCGHRYTAYTEKGTGVGAAAKLVQAACHRKADRLILVSGDNDFWPALEIGRAEGVWCEVAFVIGPAESAFHKLNEVANLRNACKRYHKLDQEFMAGCWRNT